MSDLGLQLARRFQLRHALIACGAVIAVFLMLDFGDARGFSSLRFFDLNDSDVAHRISLSSAWRSERCCCCAAGIAFFEPARSIAVPGGLFGCKASAVLFALFGVEEILGLHSWANQHGVGWNVSCLPSSRSGPSSGSRWPATSSHGRHAR